MRIRAHPANTGRRQLFEFRNQLAVGIEQFLRFLRAHPVLENFEILGVLLHIGQWNLVRPPEALQPVAADFLRRAPALRRAQHNHRPAGACWQLPKLRASCWNFLISEMHCSTVAAIAWCMLSGSEPSTKYGVQP